MRRLVLLALAAAATAQERPVEQILSDHVKALGAATTVKTLVATTEKGRACFRLGEAFRLDLPEGWSEWFGPEGAFLCGRTFERFRPNQPTTWGSYYCLKGLSDPFPLLAYVRDPGLRALLSVRSAGGREELIAAPDAHGVRTVYVLDPRTHLLVNVRFEPKEDRALASVTFAEHREVKGVMLPHAIYGHFQNVTEDVTNAKFAWRDGKTNEQVRRWEVDAPLDAKDLIPPGMGGPAGGEGFERKVFRTGADPCDLAASDLDGDGKTDIAVACEGGLSVTFGGSETTPVFVALGKGHLKGVAIDDFDADGRPEVVVGSGLDPDRTYFFVSFDAARKPLTSDVYGAPRVVHSLVTDDFDRDGLPDVAATGFGSRDLSLRFGVGTKGFRITGTQWTLTEIDRLLERPHAGPADVERGLGIATGDIDANRVRDIAVADGTRVVIFRGEPNLAFLPKIFLPEQVDPNRPWCPVAVAFADLDGDGRDDLLVAREQPFEDLSEDVIAFLNTGPSFKVTAAVDMGDRVQSVATGYLDADGKLDVAATSFLTGELVLRAGDGKGGLGPLERFPSGRGCCRVVVADWDRDGRQDLIVSNRLDDTISIFLNRRDAPRSRRSPPERAVLAAGPNEAKFALEGLSEPYEFAGEFRLPAWIRDPSGIACLGSVPGTDQLLIVSDKTSALFRVTLEREGKRLLVGPAIPLLGLENERLDLEAIAWDHASGNLFLGCEADSTILRADLFGHVHGRVKTEIASDGNDGIEAVAFRRLKDGTPILYVFKERMGATGARPPFDVYGLEDDPFRLLPRQHDAHLPAVLMDQTDAVAIGGRMFVTSRLTREVLELEFADDLFKEEVRRASYLKLVDETLGLRSKEHALFGNVEGIAVDWDYDLFLLIDNNGETLGVPGTNEGKEGRLLWFRCKGKGKRPERPDRVNVGRLLVPFDPKHEEEGAAKAARILERARKGEPLEKLAEAEGLREPRWATVVEDRIQPQVGELSYDKFPIALGRLIRNLDAGEVGLCSYHRVESPEGWWVVLRAE